MGYASRREVTNLMIGVNNYGQFPDLATTHPEQVATFSLTDKYGNSYQKSVLLKGQVFATTLVSHGAGIVDYINCSVK